MEFMCLFFLALHTAFHRNLNEKHRICINSYDLRSHSNRIYVLFLLVVVSQLVFDILHDILSRKKEILTHIIHTFLFVKIYVSSFVYARCYSCFCIVVAMRHFRHSKIVMLQFIAIRCSFFSSTCILFSIYKKGFCCCCCFLAL